MKNHKINHQVTIKLNTKVKLEKIDLYKIIYPIMLTSPKVFNLSH